MASGLTDDDGGNNSSHPASAIPHAAHAANPASGTTRILRNGSVARAPRAIVADLTVVVDAPAPHGPVVFLAARVTIAGDDPLPRAGRDDRRRLRSIARRAGAEPTAGAFAPAKHRSIRDPD